MSAAAANATLEASLQRVLGLHKAKMIDEAAQAAAELLARWPEQPDALNFLAVARRAQGRVAEAVDLYRRALKQRPNIPELYNNMANALGDLKDVANAEAAYKAALALEPNYIDAHFALGRLYGDAGRFSEAEVAYRAALALKPDHIEARNNLGNAVREQGRVEEAIAIFNAVLGYAPRLTAAHYNLGWAHFLKGDLVAGGPHYESRWELDEFKPRRTTNSHIPLWEKGQPLAGKTVLLMHEQGMGDIFQFLRFARLVRAQAAHVILELPVLLRWLEPLLLDDVEVVLTGEAKPEADCRAYLMSLPYLLGLSYEIFPTWPAYIRPPAQAKSWARKIDTMPGFKVGLFWQGNPKAKVDRGRSYPLATLAPLAQVQGVRFISLQTFDGLEQLKKLPHNFTVEDLGPSYNADDSLALFDAAAVLANLDLLITSDTGIAHLAGAMGVPCWVMLRQVPEWRWGLQGETTPWYSHMRLFRQEKDKDWIAPVRAMVAQLEKQVQQRDHKQP